MIGVPVNPNSVYVSMIPNGCMRAEFDSTYPVHLNGIISPDEFRDSINRINYSISSNKILLLLSIIFALSLTAGIICFIVGGVTAANYERRSFPGLFAVGTVLTTFGSILFSVGCIGVQYRRIAQVRKAIAEESLKYSSRSPIPCSWRLDTTRNYFGGYRNHHSTQLVNRLVIDIGRPTNAGNVTYYSNPIVNETNGLFGRQDNYAPPPYYNPSTGLCSQCGAVRQDLTARFCFSCGQSFNKY